MAANQAGLALLTSAVRRTAGTSRKRPAHASAAVPAFVPSASPAAFRGSLVGKRQCLRPPRWTSQRVTATEATTAPTSRMFVIRTIYREAGSTSVKDVEVLLRTPWQLTNPWPSSTAEDCR